MADNEKKYYLITYVKVKGKNNITYHNAAIEGSPALFLCHLYRYAHQYLLFEDYHIVNNVEITMEDYNSIQRTSGVLNKRIA